MTTKHGILARRLQAIFIALVPVVLAACERCGGPQPSLHAVHLEKVVGGVVVTHDPDPSAPGVEQRILVADDLVATAHDGEADVVFAGNTRIHLGPDTQLLVRDAQGGLVTDGAGVPEVAAIVVGGQVRVEAPAGAAPLAIQTHQGVAKLGGPKLSVLDVTIEHGLQVVTGEIGLKAHATAPPITLVAGQRVTVEGITGGQPNVDGLDISLEHTIEPLKVTIAQAGLNTRHRSRARPAWQAAKRGEPLAPGDEVVSGVKDPTRVSLGDKMRLALSQGAQLTLTKTEQNSTGQVASYALSGGAAELDIAPNSPTARQDVQLGQAQLRVAPSLQEASVALSQTGALTHVYVRFGKAQLGNTPVPAGHTIDVSGADMVAPPAPAFPEAPVALAGRNTEVFFDKAPPPVAFAWSPQADNHDVIEMATDETFSKVLAKEHGSAGRFALDRLPSGKSYWRAAGQSGQVVLSPDTGGFCATCSRETILEDTGESVVVSYQFIEPKLLLRWSKVGEMGAYRLRVFNSEDLKNPVIETRCATESYAIEPGRLSEGSYAWDVVPIEDVAAKTHARVLNRWTLTHDDTVVGLRIISPKRSSISRRDAVVTRGQLEKGFQLTINRIPVRPDKKGFFSVRVPLSPGDNALVYHITDDNNVDRYYLRDVQSRR